MTGKRDFEMPRALGALVLVLALVAGAGTARAQEIHGFVEGLGGARTVDGRTVQAGDYTAEETRLQLRLSDYGDDAEYFSRVDFLFDQLTGDQARMEIREAWMLYNGWSKVDFKLGRQILTWGTGDLLFINDVFAKDWESFFIGREDQYLKAPHDALRMGIYPGPFNVDLVLLPGFEPDRLPTSPRLETYNPFGGRLQGVVEPESRLDNGEVALRLSKMLGSWDVALYGHWGYFRQPLGVAPVTGGVTLFYPRFDTYGASLRRGLLGGIANLEGGWLYSRDDKDGDNPWVENSSVRWMWGYDRQVATDTQVGLQGYYEYMLDHDLYARGVAPGMPVRDELRQLYTLRLTRYVQYQTLILSGFVFWSPTDEDYYLRASVEKKLTDALGVAVGGNFFGGTQDQTLFGSMENNDNVFLRARYSF